MICCNKNKKLNDCSTDQHGFYPGAGLEPAPTMNINQKLLGV
jgi:hypothetical protein